MRSIRVIAATVALGAALAGCSATPTTTTSNPPTAAPSAAPASSSAAAAPQSSTVTTLDPCQLVTAPEASTLTGVSYGSGKAEADPGGARRCVYGYQTKNVFLVIVVQGSSTDQVKAAKDQIRAEAEQALGGQVAMTQVSGVGDDAEFIQGPSGAPIGISGLYVVKGTVGFALVDTLVGGTPPNQATLTGQANTVIGRLP
jgi:hypothetical protein